jgi:hypothetical protein
MTIALTNFGVRYQQLWPVFAPQFCLLLPAEIQLYSVWSFHHGIFVILVGRSSFSPALLLAI